MRTTQLVALAGILVTTAVTAGVARADIAGVYEVKYEEVSSNCTMTKLAYAPGPLALKSRGNQLIVDIDRTPEMIGAQPKNGKISAKSKLGATMVDGMKGVFSVAGRITAEGALYLVMTGEYSANGRPICTQTWNVSGAKQAAAAPATPPAKSK